MQTEVALLRRAEVEKRCGITRPSIYKFMNEGRFPRPVKIGAKAVRWRSSDIDKYLASLEKTG